MKKKSRNMVRSIIVLASVLALIMAACVGIIGFNHIKQAYYSSFQEGLHAAAVLMEDEIAHEWNGDWSLSEDGQLMKGDTLIHDSFQAQLDKLHEKTGKKHKGRFF